MDSFICLVLSWLVVGLDRQCKCIHNFAVPQRIGFLENSKGSFSAFHIGEVTFWIVVGDQFLAKLCHCNWSKPILEASYKLAFRSEQQVHSVFDEVFFGEFSFVGFYHEVIMPHPKRFGKIYFIFF